MHLVKKFIINGLIATITSLILRCIGMYFNSYISQKIGTEALGLYGLIMSVYSFAITIALSGINLATTKVVSEELAIGNINNSHRIVKKGIIFSLLFGSLASILLIIFSPFICEKWLQNKISCVPFYIIAISLPFISMSSCLNGYFTAVRNAIKPSCEQILELLMKITFITFLLNFFMPCSLEYICISLILGNIISEIISFGFIYLLYKLDKRKFLNAQRSKVFFEKRLLKIIIPVGLTSFIRSGLSTIKQVLIPLGFQKHGNTYSEALSNYGLISGMALPLVLFPNIIIIAFSGLLIPEFSEFNTRHETKRIYRNAKKALKISLYFSVITAFFLFIFANESSILMYKTTTVTKYVKILAPLIPFMYIDSVIDAILRGLDKHVEVLKINILDLVTSILLILILIPKFGIIGFIIMIYYSEILNFTLSYLTLRKTLLSKAKPNQLSR